MQQVLDRVFSISSDIRCVAIYQHGRLTSAARPGLANASSVERAGGWPSPSEAGQAR